MSNPSPVTPTPPVVLHFGSLVQQMSDEEFVEFCQRNRDWRIERTSKGELIIMPPTGGVTGNRNYRLMKLFGKWEEGDGTGLGFDSSTCFTLPNGAKRSPDLSWVKLSRWQKLSEEEQEEYPPLCPDFVVELRSRTDDLRLLKAKMAEYIANGARLGWLIDPQEQQVYVYRPKRKPICLDNPKTITGEPVLKGFVLDLQKLW